MPKTNQACIHALIKITAFFPSDNEEKCKKIYEKKPNLQPAGKLQKKQLTPQEINYYI